MARSSQQLAAREKQELQGKEERTIGKMRKAGGSLDIVRSDG